MVGGLELAMAWPLRASCPGERSRLPEVKLGLLPAAAVLAVPRLLGVGPRFNIIVLCLARAVLDRSPPRSCGGTPCSDAFAAGDLLGSP